MSYLLGGEICELVLLGVLKPKMTAAVPLGVSKVIAWKKMTEIVVIFLKQVTFISEFLLKNSNATEIILLLLTEMVSLRGVN